MTKAVVVPSRRRHRHRSGRPIYQTRPPCRRTLTTPHTPLSIIERRVTHSPTAAFVAGLRYESRYLC